MSPAIWAIVSGVGFGLFQSVNRRSLVDIDDPYVSTFMNMVVAAFVLVAIAIAADDPGRLLDADPWALAAFAGAGIVHFLGGWTFLNISQRRIGASRTSPLLTMAPVFALLVAVVAVGQFPSALALLAIVPMVAGAYLVAGGHGEARGADVLPGLACALMWAISPVLTIKGLDGLDSPLLGVTLGMVASAAAYALFLLARRRRFVVTAPGALAFKAGAGVLIAFATWWRWLAIDGTDVAVVLALALVSVPIVLFVSPLLVGRSLERVTRRVWIGAGLVVGGAAALLAVG